MKIILLPFLLLFLSTLVHCQDFGGESIEYDPVDNRFFSSSDGTSIVQRASDGTISYFGDGLQSSYGMEVMNNTLFAIHGFTVYGYDLDTESQVMEIFIGGASFLNGMASDGVNRLWVTDFGANRIHEIDVSDYDNPSASVLVSNTNSTPNGIVFDGDENRLLFANWGANAPIKQVDLSNSEVSTVVTTNLSSIDGIDHDGNGNFYISTWSPDRITRYNADFSSSEIIPVPGINNPADICYAEAIDTLAIPNGNGTVAFVGFAVTTSLDEAKNDPELIVAPNPLTENSYIEFPLRSSGLVNIKLIDLNGSEKIIQSGSMAAGDHRILISELGMAPGTYVLLVESAQRTLTRKVVVN